MTSPPRVMTLVEVDDPQDVDRVGSGLVDHPVALNDQLAKQLLRLLSDVRAHGRDLVGGDRTMTQVCSFSIRPARMRAAPASQCPMRRPAR